MLERICPRSRCAAAALAALVGLAGAVHAEAPPMPPISDGDVVADFDWVQTGSGEWLRGEITGLYDGTLYFESDEFDSLSIAWEDVAGLIPAQTMSVRLPGRRIVAGTMTLRDGKVRIDTGSEVIDVAQDDVEGIVPGEGREADYWSGKASVALSVRGGNTEQTDLSVMAEIQRRSAITRFRASYTGGSRSADGNLTANNHRVPAAFDVFLTDRFFITVPSLEYFTDRFQNIDRRVTAALGVGYEIFNTPRVLWDVGGAVAYQSTEFRSVESGSSGANDVAVALSTAVELDLPRGTEWDNRYKVQVVATDLDKTNHHAESILSFDIWGPLELQASFTFDRVEGPVRNADGVVPKQNDYQLTLGIALDL